MKDKLERISITVPQGSLAEFDKLVKSRGYANRSQAITELIHREMDEYHQENGDRIMSGTITLFYKNGKNNLRGRLAKIQREHIAEVISSLHVHLEDDHTMEVLVVQGPADHLQSISNKMLACKGVKTGKLNLSTTLIPQLHQ
jgi:CopG family nickel-responsive transcriptional regulator